MSSFVICCGGTGGHLSPGIAVAQRLKAAGQKALLVVSRKEVDERLMRNYPELASLASPGLGWNGKLLSLPAFGIGQLRTFRFALETLTKVNARALLAFGGFLTTGFVLAAKVKRLPIFLHEANAVTGRAIRQSARWADCLWLPRGITRPAWARPEHTCHLDFPLREQMRQMPQEDARARLNLPPAGRLLLVAGGSQGARVLNAWAEAVAPTLAAKGIHCLCLAGLATDAMEKVSPNGVLFRRMPFCDDMPAALSAANLAVARAGAGTIAEMSHCQLPGLLVPYPYAADVHQEHNARLAEQKGGFACCLQDQLDTALPLVLEWISNSERLAADRKKLAHAQAPDAAERIAQALIESKNSAPACPAPPAG